MCLWSWAGQELFCSAWVFPCYIIEEHWCLCISTAFFDSLLINFCRELSLDKNIFFVTMINKPYIIRIDAVDKFGLLLFFLLSLCLISELKRETAFAPNHVWDSCFTGVQMWINYFMSMIKRTVFLILLIFVEVIEHYRILSVYILSIYCCLQRLLAKSGFVYHIWLSCFLFTRFEY